MEKGEVRSLFQIQNIWHGVRCQLLELGLVIGRKVPAAKVVCQSVVAPRNVDSGHVKIVEGREEPDLTQAKLHAQCP